MALRRKSFHPRCARNRARISRVSRRGRSRLAPQRQIARRGISRWQDGHPLALKARMTRDLDDALAHSAPDLSASLIEIRKSFLAHHHFVVSYTEKISAKLSRTCSGLTTRGITMLMVSAT